MRTPKITAAARRILCRFSFPEPTNLPTAHGYMDDGCEQRPSLGFRSSEKPIYVGKYRWVKKVETERGEAEVRAATFEPLEPTAGRFFRVNV